MPNLYCTLPRTRSSRVLWMLEEIGAPYELTEIRGGDAAPPRTARATRSAAYPRSRSRTGRRSSRSAAICLALADLHPEAGLIGPDSPGRERFAEAAAALADAVGEGPWLLGDRSTVSDVLCASVLSGATSRGLLSDWPRLVAYVARGQARPAYARAAAIFDRERS